jgi:hypothetical protein
MEAVSFNCNRSDVKVADDVRFIKPNVYWKGHISLDLAEYTMFL